MIIENIDSVTWELKTNEEFLEFIQGIWDENETDENEANLERPFDVHSGMVYLISYTELYIESI